MHYETNCGDLIKVYADWRYPTLTPDEMRVIVEEAHKLHRKVAAHATTTEGIRNAVSAGVDSIEHGEAPDRAAQAAEQVVVQSRIREPRIRTRARAEKRHARPAGDPDRQRRRDALDATDRDRLTVVLGGPDRRPEGKRLARRRRDTRRPGKRELKSR